MKKRYEIEASHDGRKWKLIAGFNEGNIYRDGQPIDDERMMKEVEGFKAAKPEYKHVRLIIYLPNHN